MIDLKNKLIPHSEVKLELEGKTVFDDRMAAVLDAIEKYGSLLAAARRAGVPYSRAWEGIARIERILGINIVEPRKGGRKGGGKRLTSLGKAILEEHLRMRARIEECIKTTSRGISAPRGLPDLAIAGSNDHALEILVGMLREKFPKLDVEIAWVGSSGGLASLMLEEADIAGVHLLDSATGTYNIPFLERYWLSDRVTVIRGYKREIGLISRPDNKVEDIDLILDGKVRFINRNLGSGTRVLFESILAKKARERGIGLKALKERIRGHKREVKTHFEVARAIARGEADVGIALKHAAEIYGLSFTPLVLEEYDFVILESRMKKASVEAFVSILTSDEFKKSLGKIPGYKTSPDMGRVIYKP